MQYGVIAGQMLLESETVSSVQFCTTEHSFSLPLCENNILSVRKAFLGIGLINQKLVSEKRIKVNSTGQEPTQSLTVFSLV